MGGNGIQLTFQALLQSTFFAVALGLIVGSFINVVIARLPAGKSIATPGSRCVHCRKPIRWFDNIPVLSYLALRGKCRSCHKRISLRYPVVELLVAFLFLAARSRYGFDAVMLLRDWPLMAAFVAIVFIDIDHRIIPDQLSLGGLVVGLLTSWAVPGLGVVSSVAGAALGYGLFFIFSWAYERSTGRVGLGGGDVKLLAMFGAFFGPASILTILIVSSISGSLVGIGYGWVTRKSSLLKLAIPFGPFLVFGALYYYFLGELQWFAMGLPS